LKSCKRKITTSFFWIGRYAGYENNKTHSLFFFGWWTEKKTTRELEGINNQKTEFGAKKNKK
jgi:hypothetical protein